MKILLFIGGLRTGGAENQYSALLHQWIGMNVNVTAVILYPGGQYYQWLLNHNIKVFSLFSSLPSSKWRRIVNLVISPYLLRAVAKKQRVTHIYSLLEFSNLIARLSVLFNSTIKLIWGIRTSNLQAIKSNYPKLYFAEKLCSLLSHRVDLAIYNSKLAAEEYFIFFKIKASKIVFNGVDTSVFYKTTSLRDEFRKTHRLHSLVIGITARLISQKNHILLFKAFHTLVLQGHDIQLLIVGTGSEDFRNYLVSVATDLDILNRIFFTSSLDSQIVSAYNAMDIFCLPSINEGLSNAILEAMSCELPCVVTDVGESKFVVGDDNQVIASGDEEGLVSAFLNLIKLSETDRLELGKRNRDRVHQLFSVHSMAVCTLDAIKSI